MKANGKTTAEKIAEIDRWRKSMTVAKAAKKAGLSVPTYYQKKREEAGPKRVAAGPRSNLFVTNLEAPKTDAYELASLITKTREAIRVSTPDQLMAAILLSREGERGRA